MANSCSEIRDSVLSLDHFDYRRFVRRIVPKYLSLLIMALVISGCRKATVPSVLTQDLEQAKQALAAAGLKAGNINGTAGPGAYVTAQGLEAGKQVPRDTQIDLTVEMPQLMPDLTKRKVTDAVSTLQDMGLKVQFIKEPSLKLFGGSNVTAQSPVPATLMRRGATVNLTIATGPNLGTFLGIVTKEPAYTKLNPEYKGILDQFLGAEGGQPQSQAR